MFLATKQVQNSVSGEYSDEDVGDILDDILIAFFKIVTRGVQFVDVLDEEVSFSGAWSKCLSPVIDDNSARKGGHFELFFYSKFLRSQVS